MQPRRPRRIVHPEAPRRARPRADAAAVPAPAAAEPGLVRVSKRMAAMGLCSRREADEWIERGWVRVDGVPVTQLGTRVGPEQRITVQPAAQAAQRSLVTVLLNKPIGIVSGQAEEGYRPAIALIDSQTRWPDDPAPLDFRPVHLRGLAPAGRLDIDSTGLLVLTQDGRIARQLVGANSPIEKEYLVRVAGTLSAADLRRLNHGLVLDGVALKRAHVAWLNEDQLRIVLTEGRKRQIRRMCEAVGLTVQGLKRVRIGAVTLGRLPIGRWRYLGADERFD
jgi:23S rRNA pseudouridine2604 synthase